MVDVRDILTEEQIPHSKFINKFAFCVEPHRAILEPDYFIKLIDQAEKAREVDIERIEAGVVDEDKLRLQQQQELLREWESLQKASDDEYLMRTVLPVLYQGLKIIDLKRPVEPLEMLAMYLLQNQHQIKLPVKPETVST